MADKHRLRISQAAAFALLLAGCLSAGCSQRGQQAGGPAEPEERGVPVEMARAEVSTLAEQVSVTGTIRAHREAAIGAQVSARVTEVRVREGDPVTEGQVLITLDRTQAESQARQARAGVEAARAGLEGARRRLEIIEQGARTEERAIARSRLEQAESALRTASADLERLRGLFEQGAVSRQQLDAAENGYETARTNRDSALQSLDLMERGARPEEIQAAQKDVEAAAARLEQAEAVGAQAEEMLAYTVIRSPLTGVAYERNIDPGEITSTMGGPPLLRVADLSSVYYEATVAERNALAVRAGQRVSVTLPANGDDVLEGSVEQLVPVADPGSREFLVRISLPDSRRITRPGVFARGAIVVAEREDAVVVPKDALVDRGDHRVVFVVTDGQAEERVVEVGLTDRTRAEIRSGVEANETVVVVGAQGLRDGDFVRVQETGGD
jgi:HlyD family secretion protein